MNQETQLFLAACLASRHELPEPVKNAFDACVLTHTWPILDSDTCPMCQGQPATVEQIQGTSELEIEDHVGDWNSGETDVDWNSSRSLMDIHGNVVLECMECHATWAHPNLKLAGRNEGNQTEAV